MGSSTCFLTLNLAYLADPPHFSSVALESLGIRGFAAKVCVGMEKVFRYLPISRVHQRSF